MRYVSIDISDIVFIAMSEVRVDDNEYLKGSKMTWGKSAHR